MLLTFLYGGTIIVLSAKRGVNMKKLILFLIFLITSCAMVSPVYVRDGKQLYKATCNGLIRDISDCYALASEQCMGSFEVINTVENETDNISYIENPKVKKTEYKDNTKIETTMPTYDFPKFGGKMIKRSLFFYCK